MAVPRRPVAPEAVDEAVLPPSWITADDKTFEREYEALYRRILAGKASPADRRVRMLALHRLVPMLTQQRSST